MLVWGPLYAARGGGAVFASAAAVAALGFGAMAALAAAEKRRALGEAPAE
jgi:hypothetical protein